MKAVAVVPIRGTANAWKVAEPSDPLARMTPVVSAFETDVDKLDDSLTGDALQTAIANLLAHHGFTQATVTVTDGKISITIR